MNIFIGHDPRQPVAAQVLAYSIWTHAIGPVAVTSLHLSQLPIKRRGLTEFTYSRYLVPFLSHFEGISLFMDSDMLCRSDLTQLFAYPLAYPEIEVFVVKHLQLYEWPSLMVFNNARCKRLTPAYIEDTRNALYDMKWAETVGDLPKEWNHLVGYEPPNPEAKVVHFTQGIPCWPETHDSEFGQAWREEAKRSMSTVSFEAMMGRSVHVESVRQRLAKKGAAV